MIKNNKKLLRRKISIILCSFLLFSLLAGCDGKVQDTDKYVDDVIAVEEGSPADEKIKANGKEYNVAGEMAEVPADIQADQPEAQPQKGTEQKPEGQDIPGEKKEEKLVYTCNMEIETTEYKETLSAIEKNIKKYNGIIDYQNEMDDANDWYYSDYRKTTGTMACDMKIRIPSKDYQAFLNSLEGNGKIKSKSMNVENISRSYYDTKAVIEALEIQEQRLLHMMKEAKSIKDMIAVEERLTEVQEELNQNKTALSIMDTDVAYSTVNLNITEVLEYKPAVTGKKTNTFMERLKNVLEDSWHNFLSLLENLLFSLIYFVPFVIVFGPVCLIVCSLYNRYRRKKKEKTAKKKREFNAFKEKDEKEREIIKKTMEKEAKDSFKDTVPTQEEELLEINGFNEGNKKD